MHDNAAYFALIFAVLLCAALLLILFYTYLGPEWDLLAHYTNAQSLANPSFYSCFFSTGCVFTTQNSAFYFEPFRAPMSSLIIALLILMAKNYALQFYIAFAFIFYLFALYVAIKLMKLDPLITVSVFLSPFILYFALLANSAEILSLSFALIGISLLVRKSPLAGLFFGLASLSKYITLILLPLMLLLYKPKKVLAAIALFILPVLPWLAVNKIAFGSFVLSYTEAFSIVSSSIFTKGISAQALLVILSYTVIFSIAVLLTTLILGRKHGVAAMFRKARSSIIKSNAAIVAVMLLVLSAASYVYIAYDRDVFTQIRFGYMLYGSLSLCMALAFSYLAKVRWNRALPLVIGSISVIIILYTIASTMSILSYKPALSIWNPVYYNAAQTLDTLGYGNCNVVSNDWIYMLHLGIHAFSPFYTNQSEYAYPIIAFYNATAATDASSISDISNSIAVYKSEDFSILLPKNYTCINPSR